MLIIYFENQEILSQGIQELSKELGFCIGIKSEADICVTINECENDGLSIHLSAGKAIISYGGGKTRFYRALGLLCEAVSEGKTEFSKTEKPSFKINGSMFDVARNMVLKPNIIKAILRKQAIMGLNLFMIYLEDLFEIPEYPYFGHMRGRYSKEEIRDLDKYAQIFGIELLPAIQCLGHLTHAIQWEAMAELRDTSDILMVGKEEVYTFIDRMMASIRECFSTKRLHIGMDEAHNMGGGRYRETNELKPQFELFFEHFNRIQKIAEKYNFRLMAWSDMFFYMVTKRHYSSKAVFNKEMLQLIPRDIQLVYWQYCVFDAEENDKILKIHTKLSDRVSYAGGIQTWTSAVPLYDVTIESAKAALSSCIKNSITEVMATIWCNGSESCLIMALYGLLLYAEMDYKGVYDEELIKKRFRFICQVEPDDILDLDQLNHPGGKVNPQRGTKEDYVNTSRYLLYNDPLIGLMDKHINGLDVRTYYTNLYESYKNRGTQEGLFTPAFQYIKAIMYVLALKADYGIRLKHAYEERDMNALDVLYEDAKDLENRYNILKKTAREFYLFYNKPFGYEVMELHYATIASRFETVRYYIDKVRKDPSYKIDELEEDRLYLIEPKDAKRVTLMEYDFGRFFSAGGIFNFFDDFIIG